MKKIAVALALLTVCVFASAQDNKYYNYKDNWFAGAGLGMNIGFDGSVFENHYERASSHRGPGFAGDFYAGKWFGPRWGFRAGYQGFTVSDEYVVHARYNLIYPHADLMFRVFTALVPYIHLGYMKVDQSSLAGGVGIMFPVPVSKRIDIVPDIKYTMSSDKVYPSGDKVASLLTGTIGIAYKFGGKMAKQTPADEPVLVPIEEVVEPVDTVVAPVDTVVAVVEEPVDTVVAPSDSVLAAEAVQHLEITHKDLSYFDFDSAVLSEKAKTHTQEVIDTLKAYPNVTAVIEGHTDNVGRADYNQKLSERRAKAIYDYMVAGGIDPKRLSYKGYGEERPIDTNETAEGRHHNRRTVVVFTVEE